jgi:hypothetical protein
MSGSQISFSPVEASIGLSFESLAEFESAVFASISNGCLAEVGFQAAVLPGRAFEDAVQQAALLFGWLLFRERSVDAPVELVFVEDVEPDWDALVIGIELGNGFVVEAALVGMAGCSRIAMEPLFRSNRPRLVSCDLIRVGLEEGIQLPDGTVVRDNTDMVRAAVSIANFYGLRPAAVENACGLYVSAKPIARIGGNAVADSRGGLYWPGMNRTVLRCGVSAMTILVAGGLALAHHGTNVSYFQDKKIVLKGVVTEWAFVNPHPQLYFDVQTDQGQTEHWSAELLPTPLMMKNMKAGWTKKTMSPGDQIVLTCNPPRAAGAKACLAKELVVNGKAWPVVPGGIPTVTGGKQ